MGAFAVIVKVYWTSSSSDKEEVHLVDSEKFVIGRAPESTLVLADPKVSRKHLGVLVNRGKIYLKDLGAGNGTFVDEKRLSLEEVHAYKVGKPIKLGNSDIFIKLELFAKKMDKDSIPSELPTQDREVIENYLVSAKTHFENSEKNAERMGLHIVDQKKKEAEANFQQASLELEDFRKLKLVEANSLTDSAREEALKIVSESQGTVQKLLQESERTLQQNLDRATAEAESMRSEAQKIHSEALAILEQARAKGDRATLDALEAAKQVAKDKADQILDEAQREAALIKTKLEEEKLQFIEAQKIELEGHKKQLAHDFEVDKEKWAVERQVRDQVLEDEFQNKKNRYGTEIATLESHIAQESQKFSDLSQKRKEMEQLVQNLQTQIRDFETNLSQKKFQATEIEKQLQHAKHEKERTEKKIDDMQARMTENAQLVVDKQKDLAALQQDIRKGQDDKIEALKKINQELQMAREHIHHEAAKYRKEIMAEIDNLKAKEKENLHQDMQNNLAQFTKYREKFIKRLATEIEGLWLTTENKVDLPSGDLQKRIKDSVQKSFDESYIEMSKSLDKDVRVEVKEISQQRKVVFQWAAGISAGFVAIYLVTTHLLGYAVFVDPNARPNESAVETMSRQKLEKQAARKFTPDQDDKWKSSYTDNIIYTQGFLDAEKNGDLEQQWIRKLHQVFVKEMKLDDEIVARLVGVERSMLSRLEEERKMIHPDFVDLGVNKMREIEKESLQKIREILKTEAHVARFNSEVQKYWEANLPNDLPTDRMPASERPQ